MKYESYQHMYREPYESRVVERVACMTKNFDFTGKTVLDIGCNTGAITRAISKHADFVYGIDVDGTAVDEARLACGLPSNTPNVTYAKVHDSELWPMFLRKDGYDVILCLSVLHHVMSDSQYYPGSGSGLHRAVQLMEKIRDNCRWLWFEMGSSREFAPWAAKMPDMGSNPDYFIMYYLMGLGFKDVKVFPQPVLQKHPFQAWLHKHSYQTMKKSPLLHKLMGFDDRDSRSLFLCRGNIQ